MGDDLKTQKTILRAQRNRADFMAHVLKNPDGDRYVVGDLYKSRIKHDIECKSAGKNSAILGFMGSSKSMYLVCMMLWDIMQNKNTRLQLVCNTDGQAQSRVGAVRRYVDEDIHFKEVAGAGTRFNIVPAYEKKGHSQESWTKHRFSVMNDGGGIEPTVSAYGVNSGAMGTRSRYQVFDDIVDDRNSCTVYLRKQLSETYKIRWTTRLEPQEGFARLCGTPYWVDDLYAELRENTDWWWLIQPVSQEMDCVISRTYKNKRLVKEERLPLPYGWDKEALMRKYRSTGTKGYAQGFLLEPYADKDNVFQNFSKALDDTITPQELMQRDEFNWAYFMGYDPASSKRKGNVIIVLGLDMNSGRIGMFHVDRGAWKGGDRPDDNTVIHHFASAYNTYHPYMAYVEDNAVQSFIVEALQSAGLGRDRFNVLPCHTGRNKRVGETAIAVMDIEFANDRWIIPTKQIKGHEMTCECHWCTMTREFTIYPHAPEDDTVLSAWMAWRAIKDYGEPMKEQGNLDPSIYAIPDADPALDAIDGHGNVPGLYDIPDMDIDDGFGPDML